MINPSELQSLLIQYGIHNENISSCIDSFYAIQDIRLTYRID